MMTMTMKTELCPALMGALVVVTRGIHAEMKRDPQFRDAVTQALARFQMLDWGDTCAEDVQTNTECLETHDRLFAVYLTCNGKIYIIADPAANGQKYKYITVLYPSEY